MNKYKASNVDTKKFTWILCNVIDLLMVLTFEQLSYNTSNKF